MKTDNEIIYLNAKNNENSTRFIKRYSNFIEMHNQEELGTENNMVEFVDYMTKLIETNGHDFSDMTREHIFGIIYQSFPIMDLFITHDNHEKVRLRFNSDKTPLTLDQALNVDSKNISKQAINEFCNQIKKDAKEFALDGDLDSIQKSMELYRKVLEEYDVFPLTPHKRQVLGFKRKFPFVETKTITIETKDLSEKDKKYFAGLKQDAVKMQEYLQAEYFAVKAEEQSNLGKILKTEETVNAFRELVKNSKGADIYDLENMEEQLRNSKIIYLENGFIGDGRDLENIIERLKKVDENISSENAKSVLIGKRMMALNMELNPYTSDFVETYEANDLSTPELVYNEAKECLKEGENIEALNALKNSVVAKMNVHLGIYRNETLREDFRIKHLEKAQMLALDYAEYFAKRNDPLATANFINDFEAISKTFMEELKETKKTIKDDVAEIIELLPKEKPGLPFLEPERINFEPCFEEDVLRIRQKYSPEELQQETRKMKELYGNITVLNAISAYKNLFAVIPEKEWSESLKQELENLETNAGRISLVRKLERKRNFDLKEISKEEIRNYFNFKLRI